MSAKSDESLVALKLTFLAESRGLYFPGTTADASPIASIREEPTIRMTYDHPVC
jgi:hypothetical protein